MNNASIGSGRSQRLNHQPSAPARFRGWQAQLALAPGWAIVIFFYLFTMAWTVIVSFTSSGLLPNVNFVGLAQYHYLFASPRAAIGAINIVLFGLIFVVGSLILGFLLAVAIDQHVRAEDAFRTIFLYAQSLSFIVTGLVWQWILNPTLGIQRSIRHFGFPDFTLDWLVNTKTAIYAIGLAGIWHSAGLVMAIMLAGLRGIDQELWKAAKIDGIPMWRTYWSIIIPALRATIITASVLLAIGVIQVYDLVVATTDGGPGTATDVPAKYVMDHLFMRQNIAQAAAMATVMLVTVLAAASPLVYAKHFRRKSEGK